MSVARSKKGKSTEDKIARNAIRSDDYSTVPDCILDPDLIMDSSGKPGNKFGIGKTPVNPGVPPDIPQPSTRQYANLGLKSEFFSKYPCFTGQGHFLCNGPALINSHRCKEKPVTIHGLEKGSAFEVIDSKRSF